jgi:hypothetical protein
METVEKVIIGIVSVVGVFAVYLMFVLVPVVMYTDAECLKAGYPKSHVTIGLERYCSNLTGAVTIRVDKASAAQR